jgi:hypothetical protein
VNNNTVCDGRYSCTDKSDEMNCNVTCGKDEFRCLKSSQCIHM